MSSRLIKASDIQPPDDKARKLAEKRDKEIKRSMLLLLLGLGDLFSAKSVLQLIGRFNTPALNAVLEGEDARQMLTIGYQPIADTFLESARATANENIATAVAEGIEPKTAQLLLAYDPLIAAGPLQALREELQSTLTASARRAIQAALADGIRRGVDPQQIAENLRNVVGLDDQARKAVENFRRLLTTGDATALRRALRNERYDDLVRRAVKGEATLKPEQVDRMVADYAKRHLEHRAETIARTESMQAAVSGMRDAYTQAIGAGRLLDSEVKRFWLTAGDELVCPICSTVPLLNLDGVGVNDFYETIEGPLLAPLAHPRCRCSERYKTNLSRLHDQPFRLAA
jgi:hypothetical protein